MSTTSRFDRAEFVGGPHDGAEFVSTTGRLPVWLHMPHDDDALHLYRVRFARGMAVYEYRGPRLADGSRVVS